MPQRPTRTARIEARRSAGGARRTINEAQVIQLSLQDQQRFVDLLLNPPALAPAMKRAKKAHARLIAA